MAIDVVTLRLARKHADSLSSGIANSSYDPATSTMTVDLNDGSSYRITFDDGVSVSDREFLDSIDYDSRTNKLEVNGVEILTKDDAVTDGDDINFGGMFD